MNEGDAVGIVCVWVEVGARGKFFEDEGVEGELFAVGQNLRVQCRDEAAVSGEDGCGEG